MNLKIPTPDAEALCNSLSTGVGRNCDYDETVITVIMLAYITLHHNSLEGEVPCWPWK